jgi:hypothetical protein
MIMIGNGKIGTQPIEAKTSLPDPVVFAAPEPSVDNAANSTEPKASGGVPDIDSAAKKPGSSSAAGLSCLDVMSTTPSQHSPEYTTIHDRQPFIPFSLTVVFMCVHTISAADEQ